MNIMLINLSLLVKNIDEYFWQVNNYNTTIIVHKKQSW
jgi:hypothetical protein